MNTKKTSADRRAVILRAAIECFINKGFHTTSMRDIAQAAGVSLGNLYNYFPSKEALIAEVACQEQVELSPLINSLKKLEHPSLKNIQDFLKDYAALCSQPEWVMLSAECIAEIARSPNLAASFEANHALLLEALSDILVKGITLGVFNPEAPARVVAQVLLDAVESEAMRHILFSRPSPVATKKTQAVEILHPALLRSLLRTK